MALINIDTALKRACEILDRSTPPRGLKSSPNKRNRGVAIIKLDEDLLLVKERGYHEEEWELDRDRLARQLKALSKREFPRSRKVRLYQLDSPDEMEQPRKKL